MPANNVPSDPVAIHAMYTLPPPTLWDLCHWIAVRDSFLMGTVEGHLGALEMMKLLGPQRLGMAAHPSLPALCAFVQARGEPQRPSQRPPPGWVPMKGQAWVGLDRRDCLDLRDLLCRDLGLRPAEADRLPLTDVADHFCFRPIVPPANALSTPKPDGLFLPGGFRWQEDEVEDLSKSEIKLLALLWADGTTPPLRIPALAKAYVGGKPLRDEVQALLACRRRLEEKLESAKVAQIVCNNDTLQLVRMQGYK
jgi:hypothetical protein